VLLQGDERAIFRFSNMGVVNQPLGSPSAPLTVRDFGPKTGRVKISLAMKLISAHRYLVSKIKVELEQSKLLRYVWTNIDNPVNHTED